MQKYAKICNRKYASNMQIYAEICNYMLAINMQIYAICMQVFALNVDICNGKCMQKYAVYNNKLCTNMHKYENICNNMHQPDKYES